jgi:hypothetical protein
MPPSMEQILRNPLLWSRLAAMLERYLHNLMQFDYGMESPQSINHGRCDELKGSAFCGLRN